MTDSVEANRWSPGRRHYVMGVLCAVGLFNFIDRQVITILMEQIKAEFGATDAQMGLLTGTIFAGFYLMASFPLARLADLTSRRAVIAGCLAFWSLMTALGGFAGSFVQLALTRVGVAIGESGATPASHSLISDLYPLGKRGTAIALLAGMQAIGIGLGVMLGGWLSQTFDWRIAFICAGLPGILLAILIMLTVPEPPRGMSDNRAAQDKPALREVFRRLWALKSYRYAMGAMSLGGVAGYGTLIWGPTFFLRVHEVPPAQLGLYFGGASGLALFIGSFSSGILGDKLGRKDIRWYMWIAAIGLLGAFPLALGFLFVPSVVLSFVLYFLMSVVYSLHNPNCYSVAQIVAPLRMRAMASVIGATISTLLGAGVAPLVIGSINDALLPTVGQEAVRYSLAAMYLAALAAGTCALLSARTLRQDAHRTATEEAAA